VTTVLLVRHGLTALTGPVLAGHLPGVDLDERGQAQALALAKRLRPVPLAAIVSSPLERCVQTARAVAAGRDGMAPSVDERLVEVRYGDWTGRPLRELVKEPLWRVVQHHPSSAIFPGEDGEGLAETQVRALAAIRDWNAKLGRDATWLACSHGDVIKALLADALGLHLDLFQRIVVEPCSVSVVHYTEVRPFVLRMNDTGGDVASLLPLEPGDVPPVDEADAESAEGGSAEAASAEAASAEGRSAEGGGAGGTGPGAAVPAPWPRNG
jgi:probable phosphomutase (TIGR03848 family)